MPCVRCANCCRYHVFEPWQFKHDMGWLEARGGKMSGKYALVPFVCQHLKGNECTIYDKRPWLCKDWPGKFEDCDLEWLKSIGCHFFDELVQEIEIAKEVGDAVQGKETPIREISGERSIRGSCQGNNQGEGRGPDEVTQGN